MQVEALSSSCLRDISEVMKLELLVMAGYSFLLHDELHARFPYRLPT